MAQAEIDKLQADIDERVLRLRDLNIFVTSKACTDEQCKKFTKAYADISNEIDVITNSIFKLKKRIK